jgi:hypothetical protein
MPYKYINILANQSQEILGCAESNRYKTIESMRCPKSHQTSGQRNCGKTVASFPNNITRNIQVI